MEFLGEQNIIVTNLTVSKSVACLYHDSMPRESKADRIKRCGKIFSKLEKLFPDTNCPLDTRSPFRLLVSTILSAQCTDVRVNIVTKKLFKICRTPRDFVEIPQKELEELIRTAGLYRSKARNIRAAAKKILKQFGGRVPDTMEDLCSLPGVARKTANVVLNHGFAKNEGFVVDTHVGRLSRRMKISRHTDPVKVERDLMEITPREKWGTWSLLLVFHGRATCSARNPKCDSCSVSALCPSKGSV